GSSNGGRSGAAAEGGVAGENVGGSPGDAAGAAGMPAVVAPMPPPAVTVTVHVAADRHAISPLIYGTNLQGIACDDAKAKAGLCRLGGHRWTTYNWENNASNAGAENCSQND